MRFPNRHNPGRIGEGERLQQHFRHQLEMAQNISLFTSGMGRCVLNIADKLRLVESLPHIIREIVGRGGYASVYSVEWPTHPNLVIMKVNSD